MSRRLAAVLLASVLGLPIAASAQVVQGEDRVVFKRRTTIDIGAETFTGTMVKPTVETVNVRHRARFGSLLKLRTAFTQELVASASGL